MNVKNTGGHILTNWTNHQPTKEWLKTQPLWHGKDLAIACVVGFCIGVAFTLIAL